MYTWCVYDVYMLYRLYKKHANIVRGSAGQRGARRFAKPGAGSGHQIVQTLCKKHANIMQKMKHYAKIVQTLCKHAEMQKLYQNYAKNYANIMQKCKHAKHIQKLCKK